MPVILMAQFRVFFRSPTMIQVSLHRKSKPTKRWQGGNQSVRDAPFTDSLEHLKVSLYNI